VGAADRLDDDRLGLAVTTGDQSPPIAPAILGVIVAGIDDLIAAMT
jgi:hypothetical protein